MWPIRVQARQTRRGPDTTPGMAYEEEIDGLYGLPLDEFTAARNALAKRLRGAGDREEADAVAKLEKPSAVAWAVNQLRRGERKDVDRLLAVADELRKAQAASRADRVRELADEQQALVRRLVHAAGGLGVSPATLDRVGTALLNGASDPESRPALEAGRLVREPEPVGFGAFAGATVARPPAKTTKAPDRAAERRKEAEAAKARREAVAEARRELAEREKTVRDAEQALARAERAAAKARDRLDSLRDD
jgi:hypothetical protein